MNGNGLVKKKLNTLKQTVCQFLLTLTIHTRLTKTFGVVLMNVVSLKIHGIKHQRMLLVSQLLQKKLQIHQNLLILNLKKENQLHLTAKS